MGNAPGQCCIKNYAVTSTFLTVFGATFYLIKFTWMQATNRPFTIDNTRVISYLQSNSEYNGSVLNDIQSNSSHYSQFLPVLRILLANSAISGSRSVEQPFVLVNFELKTVQQHLLDMVSDLVK